MTAESPAAVEWQEGTMADGPVTSQSSVSWRAAEGPNRQTELSLDLTFELLKNPRRRLVIRYLESNPVTTLSTLAEHVAALENAKPVDTLSSAERKRVYISLYQCHLPKLDDAEVIEFDSNRGTVERNPQADHFEPYLDAVSGGQHSVTQVSWPLYYLGLAVTAAGLLIGHLLLFPSLASATLLAVAVIASFAGLSLFHVHHLATAH